MTEHLRLKLAQWREAGVGEDHEGHGGAGDAQRGAQRDAPVRPHQGLRETRARAGAGAAGRRTSTRCWRRWACLRRRSGHSPRTWRRSCGSRSATTQRRPQGEHGAQTPWPGVSFGCTGMSAQTAQSPIRQRTRSCATSLACHRCGNSYQLEQTVFACPDCGKGLDVVYDYELAARHFLDVPALRAPAEHLALRGAAADRGRLRAGARGTPRGLHATDPRRPPWRRAWDRQPVSEGRLQQPPELLLQGPRGVDVGREAARAGQRARSAACPRATWAPRWPRWRRRRAWTRTCSTPTAWRTPRRARAWRWARRCARWRATTTKPTSAAANWRKRRAWSSRTSRCARSTPRARRRRRSRSSSSSTGARPTTS